MEGIYALVNVLTSTNIRAFFHNQYDELRLLIRFFKHPFILHDLNNLQLLLDIIQVLFSSTRRKTNGFTRLNFSRSIVELSNESPEVLDVQSVEKVFHFLIK